MGIQEEPYCRVDLIVCILIAGDASHRRVEPRASGLRIPPHVAIVAHGELTP